jgi:hypothetical protein
MIIIKPNVNIINTPFLGVFFCLFFYVCAEAIIIGKIINNKGNTFNGKNIQKSPFIDSFKSFFHWI